jgi:hypothetical protein
MEDLRGPIRVIIFIMCKEIAWMQLIRSYRVER